MMGSRTLIFYRCTRPPGHHKVEALVYGRIAGSHYLQVYLHRGHHKVGMAHALAGGASKLVCMFYKCARTMAP